jgi:phosphoadenosine phosphosulfate reductase
MNSAIPGEYENIIEMSENLRDSSPVEVLEWAVDTFYDELGMTTAFGYSGVFLLHKIIEIKPDIDIYFIDTGFHFPQTLKFAEFLREEWDLNLHVVHPLKSREEVIEETGNPPYLESPDLCCQYNKVEPLLSFIDSKTAWLNAIRRDQAQTRADIDVIQLDQRGILKIHPLYRRTSQQIWEYIRERHLPYNPLHDKNYLSIGCQPCTRPVAGSMHEREGRWPHSSKVECGINCYLKNI